MNLNIIIVNWNSGKQLGKCLSSISHFGSESVTKIVVVDNGSIDGSIDELKHYDLPLEVIRNKKNMGFARACNQGAALCDSHYLLFLNPDTELFENSLSVPLAFMNDDANADVGICGIQLVDKQGHIARSCARFPSLPRFAFQSIGLNKLPALRSFGIHMQDWEHLETKKVDHVIGAFFLVRHSLFKLLNGFDERYFVYLEDIDFSFRAKQLGWNSIYHSGAQAFHAGGGTSRQIKATRLFYSLRSRLLYGLKHFSLWRAYILIALTLLVEPVSRTVFSLLRGGIGDVYNTWSGYRMLYRDLPDILGRSSGKFKT